MLSVLGRRLRLLFAAWMEEGESGAALIRAAMERDHAARLSRSMPRSRTAKRDMAHRLLRVAAGHRDKARTLREEAARLV